MTKKRLPRQVSPEIVPKEWEVRCFDSQTQKAIENWLGDPEQEPLVRQALDRLSANPYPRLEDRKMIKHLKGDYHCAHEYRALKNAQRII